MSSRSRAVLGSTGVRARQWLWALPLLGCSGCNQTIEIYQVELNGAVQATAGSPATGPVSVELFHASSGEGELAHPLEFIEQFQIETPGEFNHTLNYPTTGGDGLVIYAWQDRDGDGVLCALGREVELAGLVEVTPFPVHEVEIDLLMDQPCAGPEAMFPP